MPSNYRGILGPLCPDYVAPESDPRIAADHNEFIGFMCRLAKRRPDFNERLIRLIMDAQAPTKH
jgi:hypothetical protein